MKILIVIIIVFNEDLQQCMEQMGYSYKFIEADVIVRESDDNLQHYLIKRWKMRNMIAYSH